MVSPHDPMRRSLPRARASSTHNPYITQQPHTHHTTPSLSPLFSPSPHSFPLITLDTGYTGRGACYLATRCRVP
eukprot:scaffold83116_cov29-Tisochrysis_lutea.AAC.1